MRHGAGPAELRVLLSETVDALFAGACDEKLRRVIEFTYFRPAPKQEVTAQQPSPNIRRRQTFFRGRTDRGNEGAIAAFPNRTRADIAHFSAWHLDAEMRISKRMRRQPRAPAMTFLRSVPSNLDDRAFKPLRYGALMPFRRPQADRVCSPVVSAVLFFARGLVVTLLRCGQAIEARRVRAHLLELDDHLLSDVGLTRADVRFGNIATVIRQSRRPAEFAHQSREHRPAGEKP